LGDFAFAPDRAADALHLTDDALVQLENIVQGIGDFACNARPFRRESL